MAAEAASYASGEYPGSDTIVASSRGGPRGGDWAERITVGVLWVETMIPQAAGHTQSAGGMNRQERRNLGEKAHRSLYRPSRVLCRKNALERCECI